MIVPHSAICTDRMGPAQRLLVRKGLTTWVSSYDIRPARLFVGVDQRLAVYLTATGVPESGVLSSRYHRWHEIFRTALFSSIEYVSTTTSIVSHSLPKVHNRTEEHLLKKMMGGQPLEQFLKKKTIFEQDSIVYFHNAPRYWIRAMNFAPYFWNERDGEQISSQVKSLTLATKRDAWVVIAILNSSLFYWWFLILSDCRHLNLREIDSFPIGLERMCETMKIQFCNLAEELMANLKYYKTRKETRYKTTGKVVYDEFKQKSSKPIVDKIDQVLAEHYGFTDEELDFIINYDIKYRMGRDNLSGKQG